MHCIVHCIYVQCIPTLHTIIICITYNYIQCHRECRAPPPPCLSFDAPPPCRPPRCTASPWYAIGPASIETPSPYHRRVVQCTYNTIQCTHNTYTIHIKYNRTRYDTIRYDTIRYDTAQQDTIRQHTLCPPDDSIPGSAMIRVVGHEGGHLSALPPLEARRHLTVRRRSRRNA